MPEFGGVKTESGSLGMDLGPLRFGALDIVDDDDGEREREEEERGRRTKESQEHAMAHESANADHSTDDDERIATIA